MSTADIAHTLHARGLHVFPVDHPGHPVCIGRHGPDCPCDGHRGKHPAVKWGTWATAETSQMIDMQWAKHRGLANIGIACGPSNLVILDEDQVGELERWCATYGITLPLTYTVSTGRGRHLYFSWDHAVARIGNAEKAFEGFKINVRGHGGYVVGEGSVHESGHVYAATNGQAIAELPQPVADVLLKPPPRGEPDNFWEDTGHADPNTTKIGYGHRHHALVAYAGRLRKAGLDYHEAELLLRDRWLLCEQPDGQIPEARYHSPTCPKPATWDSAKVRLRDVYTRYPAGDAPSDKSGAGNGSPKLWRATDLVQAAQPRFLAHNRIPRAAITVLIGEEGIGKSLLWVLIVAAITTGRGLPEFGIPPGDPADVILILTEDDWSTTVLPRLDIAQADISRIQVICSERDGSGSPIFPTNIGLVTAADPPPELVVVDGWLDTVSDRLRVADPQQARVALHPWKEAANRTGAAMLLLAHSNPLPSTNIRDRYGASAALRQKARMTLFCLAGDTPDVLIVGPDKANSAPARTKASQFRVKGISHFDPTPDHDGTVPLLAFAGESTKTVKEHLADEAARDAEKNRQPTDAEVWLRRFMADHGPTQRAVDLYREAETEGFSVDQIKRAKRNINKSGDGLIRVYREANPFGTGPWLWEWVSTGTTQQTPQGAADDPGGDDWGVP